MHNNFKQTKIKRTGQSPLNSSKQRKDNQCLARYRWCLLSVYHDIVTCSQRKLKCLFHQLSR